jgi:SagB-type dehydrogenase family enzyme
MAENQDYEVEQAVSGHKAGARSIEGLQQSAALDPSEWPEAWRQYERKAYPRFADGARRLPTASPSDARRSHRTFTSQPVTHEDLSALLQPLRIAPGPGRTVPSAGALYPIEAYVLTVLDEERSMKISYYDAEAHALVDLFDRPFGLGPESPWEYLGATPTPGVPAYVLLTAVLYRSMRKYGARGYRYALMEAGAAGQAIDVAATRLGLGCVWLGGFDDDRVADLVGVRSDLELEFPLVLIAIGRPAT